VLLSGGLDTAAERRPVESSCDDRATPEIRVARQDCVRGRRRRRRRVSEK
jgi:hypothetical protein